MAVHVMNIVENEYLWLPLPFLPLVGGLVGLGFATIIGSFSTRIGLTHFVTHQCLNMNFDLIYCFLNTFKTHCAKFDYRSIQNVL